MMAAGRRLLCIGCWRLSRSRGPQLQPRLRHFPKAFRKLASGEPKPPYKPIGAADRAAIVLRLRRIQKGGIDEYPVAICAQVVVEWHMFAYFRTGLVEPTIASGEKGGTPVEAKTAKCTINFDQARVLAQVHLTCRHRHPARDSGAEHRGHFARSVPAIIRRPERMSQRPYVVVGSTLVRRYSAPRYLRPPSTLEPSTRYRQIYTIEISQQHIIDLLLRRYRINNPVATAGNAGGTLRQGPGEITHRHRIDVPAPRQAREDVGGCIYAVALDY